MTHEEGKALALGGGDPRAQRHVLKLRPLGRERRFNPVTYDRIVNTGPWFDWILCQLIDRLSVMLNFNSSEVSAELT